MNSYRPQIYNQAQGQFQRSPAGSFVEVDGIVQPAIAQVLAANSTINPTGAIVAISSASAIALTSTPTIADGAAGKFQQLTLINIGSQDITLQDSATLANSGLRLFKNMWTIKPDRSLTLIYRGDDWQQLFDGETLSDSDILAAVLRTDADNAGINASTLQGLARSGFLQAGNNLSDLVSRTTARSNIEASSPFWNAAKIMGVDVSPVAPTHGQTHVYNSATNQFVPGTVAPTLTTNSFSIGEIAPGQGVDYAIAGIKRSFNLLAIEASSPARVRFYTSSDKRFSDRDRPIGTSPITANNNHGLLCEVALSSTLRINLAPSPTIYSEANPVSVPIRVDNLDEIARNITLTLTYI